MSAKTHDNRIAGHRVSNHKIEIIAAYRELKNLHHVAERFGFSVEAVRKFLIKEGEHQSKQLRRVGKQLEAKIVEAYQDGEEIDAIAACYDLTNGIGTIYEVLRRNGVNPSRQPKRSANLRAFQRPSNGIYTPEQKYWAGMLLADGCIRKTGTSAVLQMNLQQRDKGHILKLQEFLQSNHKLCYLKPTTNPSGGIGQPQWGVVISGKYWIEDLAPLGVCPNKTRVAKIPDEFLFDKDYWRGVIDGDGWLNLYKRSTQPAALVGVCGTVDVCQAFGDFARTQYPSSKPRFRNSRPGSADFYSELTVQHRQAFLVIKKMYENAFPVLDRKMIKARKIIDYYEKGSVQLQLDLSA